MNLRLSLTSLLFILMMNMDLLAQKRIITDWHNGYDEVLIIQNEDFKPQWLARRRPRLLFPAAIQAEDKQFYVLFEDGSWILRKNIESQLEIKLYSKEGNLIADAEVGGAIETEEREVFIHLKSKHAMENLRFVISRDELAVKQLYERSQVCSDYPRTRRKESDVLNLAADGTPAIIALELAICENRFSLYLPGGDLLHTFYIDRKLPVSYFQSEDTIFHKGIFRLNSKYPVGDPMKVHKTVTPEVIYYSFENPNPFEVDVTASFGSEYTILLPPSLGGQELLHPPSMDSSFWGARVTTFRVKGQRKSSNIEVSIDECEFARNKFSLNISSITPVNYEEGEPIKLAAER